jgi:hypothetical protein
MTAPFDAAAWIERAIAAGMAPFVLIEGNGVQRLAVKTFDRDPVASNQLSAELGGDEHGNERVAAVCDALIAAGRVQRLTIVTTPQV